MNNTSTRYERKEEYTECKYGGPLGLPGSSCPKARLLKPQEFCFDCASQPLSRSIRFPSSCYVLKSNQRGDLTPAETKFHYLPFAKVLYEERNGFKLIREANGSTFNTITELKERKCSRFTLQQRRPHVLFEWENPEVLFPVSFVRSLTEEK